MSRVTIRWHFEAEKELAEIWLRATNRSLITASIDAIERELRTHPATKGRPYGLSELSAIEVDMIRRRFGIIPEDLRRMPQGLLEVFYVAREEDCMVIVHIVRERRNHLR